MLKCLLKFTNQSKATLQMCLVLFLFLLGSQEKISAQNCTANAGGNTIVCGDATTLTGSVSGVLGVGGATWTVVSGPTVPTIVTPNSLTTDVTGMTADGDYIFKLSYPCGIGISESQVTITAHPRPASFTAGSDVTGICATSGTTALTGVIPPSYTGSWQARQITAYEKWGITVSTNSTFSDATSATPTFSLINKANHEVDPAYYAILTIKSSDGVCTYNDEASVKFCPNPQINVPLTPSSCIDAGSQVFFDLSAAPYFNSATPNSSGAIANGTTITFNVVSQPVGGNIIFDEIDMQRIYFSGASIIGDYVFSITVTTACCGTFTTPQITYTNNGINPNSLNFQPTGHGAPEQLALYSYGGSAGEVHCGIAGTSTPELFYFDLDPSDPATLTTTVTSTGILPTGASAPIITLLGAGTMNRSVSVDPGASGWKIGTYYFNVDVSSGSCGISQGYYIHISDGNRPPLSVSDVSICYPGSGTSTATIALPAVYVGLVDPSYLQDFGGWYNFTVLSQPSGSGTLAFEGDAQRSLTSTSTTISNLTIPGDYVIRMTPFDGNGVGQFIEQEYACSGINGPLQADFTIHVDETINANAGGNQIVSCSSDVPLQGNSLGVTGSTGLWTVDIPSLPVGAATPTIVNPTNNMASVIGIDTIGTYTFTWTITSAHGACTSFSNVSINIQKLAPDSPTVTVVQPTCTTPTGSIIVDTPIPSADIQYSIDNGVTFQDDNRFLIVSTGTYQVLVKSASIGCNSLPKEEILAVPVAPTAPVLGTVTQPTTCAAPNGTFQITNYDAVTYTYVFTPAVISISATGLVTASAGNYTVTITDIVSGCISAPSNSVTVTATVAPAAPVLGTVTQPTTCAAPNGTFQIVNYDAATYTYVFTPVVISISATGLVTASAGNYTVTITDIVSGCASVASNSVTVNAAPAVPATPVLGTVTQPTTCAAPNGTFQITNYDAATYTYIFTPAVISISATGLVTASAGDYTVAITDIVSGCVSGASNSVTVNPAPVAPVAPVLGTVTQPTTCAAPNGTFQITNYDVATYTYVFAPAVISISATGLVTASAGDYTVAITDIVSGCVSGASNSVTVNLAPVAPVAPVLGTVTQPTTCAAPNGTFQITNYDAAIYTYVFTPAVISISATGLVTASAGDYTVAITDIVSGCVSGASNSVTVNPAPVAPVAPVLGTVTQPTTCADPNGTFQITNYDVATYTYVFAPAVISISATGLVTASAGDYTVTITDIASGCVSGASNSVTVNPAPVAPVAPVLGTVTQPTTCAAPNGTFQITNYDVATYTYVFTPAVISISATGLVTASAGDYTVAITDIVSGCVSGASNSVTVNPAPVAPVAPVLDTVTQPTTCAAPNGTFQITNYDVATYTYIFTPAVISISATGLVTASAGDYTVAITDIVSGCVSGASNSVTVNLAPVAPAAPVLGTVTQPTTCAAPNGTFQITNYDAAIYTYVFTPAVISISATGLVTASAGDYTVAITDIVSGCVSGASNSVTVNPAPVAPVAPVLGTVTQPTTCADPNGTFQITNYDVATYTYVFTPAVISISATGLVTASAGDYTVAITDIVSGCVSGASNSVTVNPAPVAPVSPVLGTVTQPTTCAAPNGTFQITNYDVATYTYVFAPAVISISATGLVTASAGDYTVAITDIVSGCVSGASNSVTVNLAPVAPAVPVLGTVTQPTCSTATGSFVITNYDLTMTYIFTPSIGVTISSAGVVIAPSGTYTVMAKNLTSGCTSAASSAVLIQSVICAKTDDYTELPINGTNGGTTASVLVNDTLNGVILTPSDVNLTEVTVPTGLTLNADGTITVALGTAANTYVLTYRICEKLNPTNCDTTTATVVVTAAPIDANDDSGSTVNGIIGGTSFTNVLVNDTLNGLPVVATNVNTTFVSSTNAGVTLSGTDVVVAAGTPAGSYTLTYRICEKLNLSNCDDATVSVTVVVANNPSIALVKTAVFNDVNNDGYAQVGETITYVFTVTNTGDTALTNVNITDPLPGINLKGGPISLSAGQSDSSSFIGVYTLTQDDINLGSISNQAKATGTDPNGTIVSDLSNDTSAIGDNPTVLPIIRCVIEVFNALSPNGDGENDVLHIGGIECYPDNTVEIYNRWGVLVYERDHYNNTDGAFKGISEGRVTVNQSEELPVGTYYYVIKYRDSNSTAYKKSGYLYINRK